MSPTRVVLGEAAVERYARHILLPEVGGRGQVRLLESTIAVEVGPDRPAAQVALAYLAAAGVGRLVLGGAVGEPVTVDEVSRGVLLGVADVGRARGDALAARIRAINPDVAVVEGPTGGPWLQGVEPVTGEPLEDALVRGGLASARAVRALVGRAP